ncbi:MAG: phosphatidate cytidylyltransferase [Flavobacteriales bacterium]
MNELGTRALTGSAYVALTLGAAFAGPFTTFLLFFPVCLLAADEMHRLMRPDNEGTPRTWSILLAATMYPATAMGVFQEDWDLLYSAMLFALLLLVTVVLMMIKGDRPPAEGLGGAFIIMLLVSVPFGLLPYFFDHGKWVFVGFMLLLWTNDTGAYLVGRAIGRVKLMPSVSPNKTLEGFLGGVVLTLGVAFVLARYRPELGMYHWLACGAIVAVTSTLGDLMESAFKRARGVKDSGRILPGHGGILDRFDGFLLAVPAVLLFLWYID